MKITNIPIVKKPNFIVVTTHDGISYVYYHLDDLSTLNKNCDIGFWHIKYKETN